MDRDWLAKEFEAAAPRLTSVAYRSSRFVFWQNVQRNVDITRIWLALNDATKDPQTQCARLVYDPRPQRFGQ